MMQPTITSNTVSREQVLYSLAVVQKALAGQAATQQPFLVNLLPEEVAFQTSDADSIRFLPSHKIHYGPVHRLLIPRATDQTVRQVINSPTRKGLIVAKDGVHGCYPGLISHDTETQVPSAAEVESMTKLMPTTYPSSSCIETGHSVYLQSDDGSPIRIYPRALVPNDLLPSQDKHIQGYHLPNGQKVRFVGLSNHIHDDKFKSSEYSVEVFGQAYDPQGRPKPSGPERYFVYYDQVVFDTQMLFWKRLSDKMVLKVGEELDIPVYEEIIQDFVDQCQLNLVFDPAEMDDNEKLIYVGNDEQDKVQKPAVLSVKEEWTQANGAAAFHVSSVSDPNKVSDYKNANPQLPNTQGVGFIKELGVIYPHLTATYAIFPGVDSPETRQTPHIKEDNPNPEVPPFPDYRSFGYLEIMIMHEFIHAHQNCLDPAKQGGREISNFLETGASDYEKRCKRELLAYHFTIFHNKRYPNPSDDPVFRYTRFVRGVSYRFMPLEKGQYIGNVHKALQYIDFLTQRDSDGNLIHNLDTDYWNAINDIQALRQCFENESKNGTGEGVKFYKSPGVRYDWNEFKEKFKSYLEADH
ncbi:MAG: hypothetical protein AAFQ98_21170 [Bacteroidota bacterium]